LAAQYWSLYEMPEYNLSDPASMAQLLMTLPAAQGKANEYGERKGSVRRSFSNWLKKYKGGFSLDLERTGVFETERI
jgi:hypothetical protein